ncbi:MAG: OprO/OprP family phosphate-selective porin [Terriglobia bacterium]
MSKRDLLGLCGSLVWMILLSATPAFSANHDLVNILLQNGIIGYRQCRARSKSYGNAGKATQRAPRGRNRPKKKASVKAVHLKCHSAEMPEIGIATANENFTLRLGGELQADAAFYGRDKKALGKGQQFRRARLFVVGKLFGDWAYQVEVGFDNNRPALHHSYLRYNGLNSFHNFIITLGLLKQPFSLQQRTSSKYITFMERALPSAFVRSDRIGLRLNAHGSNWSAAAGAFGQKVTGNEHHSGVAGVVRATFAPVHDRRHLLHIGASLNYRFPGGSGTVRFRSRPESHITRVRLVDTGRIADVDHFQVYGAEASAVWGPIAAQGEYIDTQVARSALPTLNFNGWYAQASWFVTGESRATFYDASTGAFGRVIPRHKFGAVDLAVRYSTLDLNDRDIRGGAESDITEGISWYPNTWLRFSANYVSIVSMPAGISADPNIFEFRGQVVF